ncbi:type II secretion system protein J [Candidatus Omnitrophota bacterium]
MKKRSGIDIRRQSLEGFTFIELLIALTVFSIMAASIYYTLNSGIKIWERGNFIIKDNQRLRTFFDTISLDMRNAVPYAGIEHEWGAKRISFPTIINVFDNNKMNKELARIIYFFDSEKGELVKICATLEEGFDEKRSKKRPLLSNVEDFTLEYGYKSLIDEEDYEWEDEWGLENKIPQGVRVRLDLKMEDGDREEIFETVFFIPIGEVGKEERIL